MDYGSDILTVEEAANYLKFNVQTIRRLAREGRIPAFRVGGNWRFKKSALDEWFLSQKISAPASLQPAPRPGLNILVVDDEPDVIVFLTAILEAQGNTVTPARNGLEALEKFALKTPDLIFLDLKMSQMDGPTFLETLWAGQEAFHLPPVIILSGYPDSDLMMRALKFSPLMVLIKPASTEQVLKAVRNVMVNEEPAGLPGKAPR